MAEHVTLIRPEPSSPERRRGTTTSLPTDLMQQVRGRLQLLAVLSFVGAAVDPLFFFGHWLVARLVHLELAPEFWNSSGFQWASLGVMAASAGLWWTARGTRVPTQRLIGVGLTFEVLLCLQIASTTIWQEFLFAKTIPSLTWVPAVVILFPLVLPGPPRQMLAGSALAAAMWPLSLFALDRLGLVQTSLNAYIQAIVGSTIAVGFASMASRVIYGLGKQLAAARELGSYHLEEKLGEGGMGEVWRARHRLLARPAAIKLIRTGANGDSFGAGSAEALKRFEREAQATAMLRSPHTVNVFDFGVAQDGAFYYVMELLEGLDANKLVRQFGPLPAERAVFLMRQVCHSLSEAESVGLVHRDIKPANVFVCRYGEDHDFVKVLDFGLVKALSGSRVDDPGLTRESVIHGTPAFMAPEQAMGLADLDHRVDIYAAGCLTYWLLTGRLVFEAPNSMALLFQHGNSAPSAPSTRTELPIPEALDRLVLACLEKDPARRPQSARELSERLAATVDAGAWSEERSRAWWRTHRPAARPVDGDA
jgi:serine/threonine-protein kinase